MKYIFILILLLISGSVQANPSAAFIVPGCVELIDPATRSTPTAGYCAGAINGVMGMSLVSNFMCPPIGLHTLEIATKVAAYENDEDALSRDFVSLVIMVMTIEYPCQSDPGS